MFQEVREYCGQGLTLNEYEILTLRYIAKKDRPYGDESALMSSKWFDYRFLHPMEATYLFYSHYVQAHQNYFKKAINHEVANNAYPFKGEAKHDFLLAKEAPSIWRLRKIADFYGIKYDFFCNGVFNNVYRVQFNGKVVAPRPAMLRNEDIVKTVYNEWLAYRDGTLLFSCNPYFKVSSFESHDVQIQHEDFVIGQIQRKQAPEYALASSLYIHQVVRIEKALQVFDEQTMQSAIYYAKRLV